MVFDDSDFKLQWMFQDKMRLNIYPYGMIKQQLSMFKQPMSLAKHRRPYV